MLAVWFLHLDSTPAAYRVHHPYVLVVIRMPLTGTTLMPAMLRLAVPSLHAERTRLVSRVERHVTVSPFGRLTLLKGPVEYGPNEYNRGQNYPRHDKDNSPRHVH